MADVTIGQAARVSGVKVPTIRYYEEVGLLSAPNRTASRRRVYTARDLRRLSFIRHARELGFDVEAIRALLTLQDNPDQSCAEADAIARARLGEVERKIASLRALKDELRRMIEECACGTVAECRVIETLVDRSHHHGHLD